jgi:hypothetical protein
VGLSQPRAAKAATTTIPIVFVMGGDPVKFGLVNSLNHPGGNVTGIGLLAYLVEAKRLELVHELLPRASKVAVLVNPTNSETESGLLDLQAAAPRVGQQLIVSRETRDRVPWRWGSPPPRGPRSCPSYAVSNGHHLEHFPFRLTKSCVSEIGITFNTRDFVKASSDSLA